MLASPSIRPAPAHFHHTPLTSPTLAGSSSSMSPSVPVAHEPKSIFVLGTRVSKLAMVQTELVKRLLEEQWPTVEIRICGMTTAGDKNQTQPLYLLGGKALWTKELEVALLDKTVDAIVHSLKDVPTSFPDGCDLGAVLEREDPSDALVVKAGLDYLTLDEMPEGSVIGTSSVRRVAQLRKMYPKLKFADIRGNLQTRLRKLDDPTTSYTALILASAGLIRLNQRDRITTSLTSPILLYAVSQGAIGVEIRDNDERARDIVGALEEWKTGWTTRCERSMLRVLEGGCSVPVACESVLVDLSHELPSCTRHQLNGTRHIKVTDPHRARLTLTGNITSLSGTNSVTFTSTAVLTCIADAEALGALVAHELIKSGGKQILEELGKHVKEVGGEEGKELPFQSNNGTPGEGGGGEVIARPTGTPRPRGMSMNGEKRTIFTEAEICLRPSGW